MASFWIKPPVFHCWVEGDARYRNVFHEIGEDEPCDGSIYATSGGAALEAATFATVGNLEVLVLDD